MTTMTSEQQFIPLNDIRKMKRSDSRGSSSDVDLEHEGMQDTTEYRLQAVCPTGSRKVSLWHDISLVHVDPQTREETPYFNFVCEIPKFTRYVCRENSGVVAGKYSPCHCAVVSHVDSLFV